MDKKVNTILRRAARCIGCLKTCIEWNGDEAARNKWRGTVEGLLLAASIITGNSYDWDSNGIYENGGNEPVVKA